MMNPANNKKGMAVPMAKTGGRTNPYEEEMTMGMTIPKNNQNIVGQNPREKEAPNKKAPHLPRLCSATCCNFLDSENPRFPGNRTQPIKKQPIKIK